ncbi:MAG: N-acetylglucosamine kinase, partial [Candidatus Acidiferrales bacterium]
IRIAALRTRSMEYFLGFDGGGTKTECVLMDSQGKILAETRSGPSNPLRSGFERSFDSLGSAAAAALSSRQLPENCVTGVCAGIAGAGRTDVVERVAEFLRRKFSGATVRVTTDLEIALETAAGAEAGLVLVAGTGSAAFGRNARGRTARAGGEGPQIGDLGSAFDIGRHAWNLMVSSEPESARSRQSVLTDRIYQALGSTDSDSIARRISKNPDDIFPRLFPPVVSAAELGDSSSRKILLEAAGALSKLASAVVIELGMESESFILAEVGGVFGKSTYLDSEVNAQLARIAPKSRIVQLKISPARGAAEMARRAAGRKIT